MIIVRLQMNYKYFTEFIFKRFTCYFLKLYSYTHTLTQNSHVGSKTVWLLQRSIT